MCPLTRMPNLYSLSLDANGKSFLHADFIHSSYTTARGGGTKVSGWTVHRKNLVRFPTYPHRVWALWWHGGKRRRRTSQCPCQDRLGPLNPLDVHSVGCPATGLNFETGQLSRHYIAEISPNVTLNHSQPTSQSYTSFFWSFSCIF